MRRKGHNFKHAPMVIMDYYVPESARVQRTNFHGKLIDTCYIMPYQAFAKPTSGVNKGRMGNRDWWFKAITVTGHSRTNMAYGILQRDGERYYRKIYWAEDGHCFTSRIYYDWMGMDEVREKWPEEFARFRKK